MTLTGLDLAVIGALVVVWQVALTLVLRRRLGRMEDHLAMKLDAVGAAPDRAGRRSPA